MKQQLSFLSNFSFLFWVFFSFQVFAGSDHLNNKEKEVLDQMRATEAWLNKLGLHPMMPEESAASDSCLCEEKRVSYPESMNGNQQNLNNGIHKGTLITNTCTSCHDSKDTAFKITPWIDDQSEWDKRLYSADPKVKKEAFHLLSQLYNTLVDAKNMPPLSEKETRKKFFENKEREAFVAFVKNKFESLNGEVAPKSELTVAPNRVSVMEEELEKKYRSLFPKTTSPKLNSVFQDPNLIFMDKKHMVPGYQDPSNPVTGERSTEPGFKGAGFANDSPFIDKNGHLKLWSFGFGLEPSPNARSFHFIQLPKNEDGTLQKIKVSTHGTSSPDGGKLYEWEFPVGTVSGEVTLGTDSSGQQHILQIRLRTKDQESGPWAADIYKPYPTKESLSEKLTEISSGNSTLASEAEKVLRKLNKPGRLKATSLGMHDYQVGDLDSHGGTEELPEMSEALTFELLKEPFKSSLGTEWDKQNGITAFAPTSKQAFSLVTTQNNEGAVRVDRQNCSKCHKDSNKPIRTFYTKEHPKYYSSILAYANTPGDDQQLRFNPFDQTLFKTFGGTGVTDNRKLNPKLLPILEVTKNPK